LNRTLGVGFEGERRARIDAPRLTAGG
jgi:hypothetical protein